jgi:hypothetical protein
MIVLYVKRIVFSTVLLAMSISLIAQQKSVFSQQQSQKEQMAMRVSSYTRGVRFVVTGI